MTERQLLKNFQDKSVNQILKKFGGEMLGSGAHRDVFEIKGFPTLVLKIERDPSSAKFANVMEWRNYIDYRDWNFLKDWLAPCELINETGQLMVQQRVSWEGKRRKDYPTHIPSVFTDLKLTNFGWIGDRFVCCDYSFFHITQPRLKYAKWWGSLKKM